MGRQRAFPDSFVTIGLTPCRRSFIQRFWNVCYLHVELSLLEQRYLYLERHPAFFDKA